MTHCEIGYCVMSVSLRFVSLKAKYMRVMFEGWIDFVGSGCREGEWSEGKGTWVIQRQEQEVAGSSGKKTGA